jgi:methylated-DNA-protein-cysteine methyltransferase related protein
LNSLNFFERVYETTRIVPYGRVTTYGAIARFLGSAQSSRMVGWALNASSGVPDWVPAHRVVNRNELLTGKHHFPGRETMRELLQSEGIMVEDDRVVNFKTLFWDPNTNDKDQ